MVHWSGGSTDAVWTHMLFLDPEELEKLRRHQMMALARYARAPLLGWDDVATTELTAWYAELKELLKAEGEASRTMEDR